MTPPDHITPNFPFGLNNSNNNSLVTPNYHFFFNSTTNQTASFHHQHTQYYMQHEHQLEVDNDGGSSYDLGKKNEVGSGLKLSLWKREDKLLSSEIKKLDQEKKKNSTNSACIKLKLGDQKQKPIQTDYCSNNIPIRVCTDCNTTKTPLWRSGPKGPKSLCNACGIRQRKARRAMAAAAAEGKTDQKVQQHKQNITTKVTSNNDVKPLKKRCKFGPSSSSTNNAPKKLGFEDFLINLSNKLAFQQIFPQDEMEAAILLMALSSGLVHG
ncbi:putative GATA transcription factor 22 [Solanum pennellii]|uniref:GATA transcription factor 22 n=1 Tax=Solanum pennellii TaxID=28526 RepID=A0ABM1H5E6_SOLPN|nr:putative GATA transcription factor 22 [Solanum pennellii]